MANLANFIYCLNAERIPNVNGEGGSINAMGILSVLSPETLPGAFSFSVIFSVLDADISAPNTVRLRLLKEGIDKPIVDTGILGLPPTSEKNEIELPPEYVGLNMSMDFRNIVFETEGVYTTEVTFNGIILGKKPIYVKGKRQLTAAANV